jgi:hypothetical protein
MSYVHSVRTGYSRADLHANSKPGSCVHGSSVGDTEGIIVALLSRRETMDLTGELSVSPHMQKQHNMKGTASGGMWHVGWKSSMGNSELRAVEWELC